MKIGRGCDRVVKGKSQVHDVVTLYCLYKLMTIHSVHMCAYMIVGKRICWTLSDGLDADRVGTKCSGGRVSSGT